VVRVSVEVGGDAGHFRMLVEAESIERAVSLARECYPGLEVKVIFPMDPKAFFVEASHPVAGSMWLKRENRAYARSFK